MKSEFVRITERLASLYHTTQPEMARKIANHAKAAHASPLTLARKVLADTSTFTPRRLANITSSKNLLPSVPYDALLALSSTLLLALLLNAPAYTIDWSISC